MRAGFTRSDLRPRAIPLSDSEVVLLRAGFTRSDLRPRAIPLSDSEVVLLRAGFTRSDLRPRAIPLSGSEIVFGTVRRMKGYDPGDEEVVAAGLGAREVIRGWRPDGVEGSYEAVLGVGGEGGGQVLFGGHWWDIALVYLTGQ